MINRISRVIRRHGFGGALRHGFHYITGRNKRRIVAAVDRQFDDEFGVDTGGKVSLDDLKIESENKEYGSKYQGINPVWLKMMITASSIDPSEFKFIDLGSGKGRALLIASEFAFEQIIGVEFSPELNATARRNVDLYASDRQRCRNLVCICGDAAAYAPPPGPIVLFLNNPFEDRILRRVLKRFQDSLAAEPRRMFILAVGAPAMMTVIEEEGFKRMAPTTANAETIGRISRFGGLFEA
jgi:hypothetical protein